MIIRSSSVAITIAITILLLARTIRHKSLDTCRTVRCSKCSTGTVFVCLLVTHTYTCTLHLSLSLCVSLSLSQESLVVHVHVSTLSTSKRRKRRTRPFSAAFPHLFVCLCVCTLPDVRSHWFPSVEVCQLVFTNHDMRIRVSCCQNFRLLVQQPKKTQESKRHTYTHTHMCEKISCAVTQTQTLKRTYHYAALRFELVNSTR